MIKEAIESNYSVTFPLLHCIFEPSKPIYPVKNLFSFAYAGVVTIGFRTINGTASVIFGKLSGFNIWSTLVTAEEILSMSYGCGKEVGNAMAWGKVRNGLIGEVEMQSHPTCNDGKRKSYLDNFIIVIVVGQT